MANKTMYRWIDKNYIHAKTGKRVSPATSLVNPNVHNPTSGKKLATDQRRQIVMQLRMQRHKNGAYYSFSEIAEIMQEEYKDILDKSGASAYPGSSAYRDVLICIKAIHNDIKELAKLYLDFELEKLNELDASSIRANELLYSSLLNFDPEVDDLHDIISSINKLSSAMVRTSEKKSKLLGMDAPKEVDVRQANINMTMDDWLDLQKRALQDFKGELPELKALVTDDVKEVIEGRYEEEEE